MTSPIIIILVLIGVIYRHDVMAKRIPGKPFWHPYRKMLALLALTLLPVLAVNYFVPEYVMKTPDDKVELGRKNHKPSLMIEGYQELARLYPDSIEIQMQLIDYRIHYNDDKYEDFDLSFKRSTPLTKALLSVYIEIASDSPKVRLTRLDSVSQTAPFVNYVRGLAYKSFDPKDLARTRYYLRKEVILHPDSKRAWEFLWTIFLKKGFEKELDALMQNDDAERFIPNGYRQDYYFEHQQVGNYVDTIIEARFLDVKLITFISAFLVSFVWLVFLRSMDVFNRERWINILLVFIGGALFTHFCLPIYDYAHLVLDFRMNGEVWNDFLYCVTVIGGGEELVKLLPWVIFALLTRRLREPYDYLLYASVAALGFSFAENLMYLEDSGNIVVRSIMSTVGHMFDASVVAYAVILAKYKFKNPFWKLITPILGFVFAALCHGFYDFWLISTAAEGYYFVTVLFFLVSLHVWFYFKNNAMNNSGFFSSSSFFNAGFHQDLLTFSILGLLMLEFLFISLEFGSIAGNGVIGSRAIIVVIFLVYISVIIHKIDLKKGVWNKYRFRLPQFSRFLRLPYGRGEVEENAEERDFIGLPLRLFAPKTNRYIGDKLPKSGVCIRRITVSGNENWYVFQLNDPIHYNNYVPTHIILKGKNASEPLDQPKIEIYFMFIPDIHILQYDHIDVKQLRYAGRAYSMPVGN